MTAVLAASPLSDFAKDIYAREKAKRGIEIPRATGCPRTMPKQRKIEVARTKRTAPPPANPEATRQRRLAWRKMYEDDRMSVTDIALKVGVQPQSVSRALRAVGTEMRKRGHGEIVAKLKRENAALRGRILHYRSLLKKLGEAA